MSERRSSYRRNRHGTRVPNSHSPRLTRDLTLPLYFPPLWTGLEKVKKHQGKHMHAQSAEPATRQPSSSAAARLTGLTTASPAHCSGVRGVARDPRWRLTARGKMPNKTPKPAFSFAHCSQTPTLHSGGLVCLPLPWQAISSSSGAPSPLRTTSNLAHLTRSQLQN